MWLHLGMAVAALATSWAAWLMLRPLLRDVPAVNAMPWWWRMSWPWTVAIAPLAVSLCPRYWRARLDQAISQAGLPTQIRAEHIVALSLVATVVGSVLLVGGVSLALHDGGGVAGASIQAWRQGSVPIWVPWVGASGALAGVLPGAWLRGRGVERRRHIDHGMPFALDMMTLCVEAGLSVQGALQLAASSGPRGPLRDALADALADMRAGVSRAAALQAMAGRCGSPLVRNWAVAIAQADALGISLGPVLRAQGAQCRSDRHLRAERLAMQAPVKMLLPLIGCIFPCTFIVLAFPIAVQLLRGGG